eukprot:CAMPEP_0179168918 /NCGR_PEP_ID=MMETSP0796-20121207/83108_1 /TAXON_ID=73915 /ORGANISM="Pyrodinium bahamense, Strain pbaha01" /LENGTH=167 /DNA_ID=CAMNT_0020871705 /DNA_START=99 /DNA_END=598 /DNA_ORIENTATION=-
MLCLQAGGCHVVQPLPAVKVISTAHAHDTTSINDHVVWVETGVLLLSRGSELIDTPAAANELQLVHMWRTTGIGSCVLLQLGLGHTFLTIDHQEIGTVSVCRSVLFQLSRCLAARRSPSCIEVNNHGAALASKVREAARSPVGNANKFQVRKRFSFPSASHCSVAAG